MVHFGQYLNFVDEVCFLACVPLVSCYSFNRTFSISITTYPNSAFSKGAVTDNFSELVDRRYMRA